MRIDAAFPSQYLKAADLQGRSAHVTMNYVKMEDIGGDHKPILYFVGKEKGLVLNKTNSNNIGSVYGFETDDWAGKPVELFPTMVDFQGKSVDAIRVRIARAPAAAGAGHPFAPNGNGHPPAQTMVYEGGRQVAAGHGGAADMPSDEIPFSPQRD